MCVTQPVLSTPQEQYLQIVYRFLAGAYYVMLNQIDVKILTSKFLQRVTFYNSHIFLSNKRLYTNATVSLSLPSQFFIYSLSADQSAHLHHIIKPTLVCNSEVEKVQLRG